MMRPGYNQFLKTVLFLQLVTFAVILLNIPIARQVVVFVYLTLTPGMIIVRLLHLNNLDGIEKILFIIGFSFVFLMLTGIILNELSSFIGFTQPLSTTPLLLILSIFVFSNVFLLRLRNQRDELQSKHLEINPPMLILLALPILSVVGSFFSDSFNNNAILLFMLIAIALLFGVGFTFERLPSPSVYPMAVLTVTISLLLHSSLMSRYLLTFNSDVPLEFFLFKTTEKNAFWDSTSSGLFYFEFNKVNTMLSVTILPTVYSNLLNIHSELLFKILFPIIFSFVPVGLYKIWSAAIGKKYAFASVFFFVSYFFIYTELLGLNRQIIAELFLVLLLLLIQDKKMQSFKRTVCFVLFSFGLVVSHYGTALIFSFFILFALFYSILTKKFSNNVTTPMVISFFTIMFSWYIFVSRSSVFEALLRTADYIYGQLSEFFNPYSRGEFVVRGLGLESPPTILNAISRAFAYATQLLIIVGFYGLVTKKVKVENSKRYFIFSGLSMIFLICLILVPGLANTMAMSRFYHLLLFFLAPLCVLGAKVIVKMIYKREKEFLVSIILFVVLVPYFLFQTNFIYEVTGSESWSVALSKYRMSALKLYCHFGYKDTCSVYGAQWLPKRIDLESSPLYADKRTLINILTIYSLIPRCNLLSNTTDVTNGGVVYLSKLNVIYELIPSENFLWNSSQLSYVFDRLNIIYNNGGSEIYKNMS